MDLSQSVVLPREDFFELQAMADNQPPTALKDKLGTALTTSLWVFAFAAAVTAGSWGWASAMEWKEKKSFEREYHPETTKDPQTTK